MTKIERAAELLKDMGNDEIIAINNNYCDYNNDGDLFIGDDSSGANAIDTPQNRQKILNDFSRYTKENFEIC